MGPFIQRTIERTLDHDEPPAQHVWRWYRHNGNLIECFTCGWVSDGPRVRHSINQWSEHRTSTARGN